LTSKTEDRKKDVTLKPRTRPKTGEKKLTKNAGMIKYT